MKRRAAYVIAATLFAFGIVHAQATKNPGNTAKPLARGKIRFTPIELFPGDLKRLQTHLEMEGACFKFEYDGPKKSVHFVLQILEKGKRDVSPTLFLKLLEGRSSGEVSVSIRKVDDARGQSAWHMIAHVVQNEENGFSSSTQTITKTLPAKANGSGGQSIGEVTDSDVNDEVALWCKVRSGRPIQMSIPMDEMANDSDFAVVLKLVPGGPDDVD